MAKAMALLLLLAVAASQVDISHGEILNITSCPIAFFGKTFTFLDLSLKVTFFGINIKNSPSEVSDDYIWITDRTPANTIVGAISSNSLPASYFNPHLPHINSSSTCSVNISVGHSSDPSMITLSFHNFGKQTVMELKVSNSYIRQTVGVDFDVNDNVAYERYEYPKATVLSTIFKDISACRFGDEIVPRNITIIDPQTCMEKRCDASTAVFRPVRSTCGPKGVCQGRNMCLYPSVCTVTGSTVVDFLGRNRSVPDRCVYSLLKPQESSDFNLLAGFGDRRRKDVTFLDHVILWLKKSGVTIYLGQGGRVRVDDQILTLNATAQTHHGVELSKDKTGVTATFNSTTVLFDGNTLHVKRLSDDRTEGLCGHRFNTNQTTTLSAEKSSNYSAAGCEIEHNDTFDSTINCSRATEHCNLLRQAPFTACHSSTDPEHYITACTNTLCKYPEVDSVKCQFLEAYAKSCSLWSNITVEGWRSKASCSAVPQTSCQDQDCSAHEFCGVELGDTRCLCRASFASKYKPTNAFGEPTVCTQNSATVHLARCLLEDKDVDYTVLHLTDLNCTGHVDRQTNMVTFSFNSSNTCGTQVMMNDSQVIYKNTITNTNGSTAVITRRDQVVIDFSCYYAKPEDKSMTFKIRDSSVILQIASGVWNYTLIMNTYTDPDCTNLISENTEISLNQRIWVELKAEELDNKTVALVIDSCWATNEQSPDAKLRYDLIKNRCPKDQTVRIVKNGLGKSNLFSFNMFEFSGKNREMFLHCKLELCIKRGNSCAANCGQGAGRKRRSFWSKPADENPALITMGWSH